MEIRKKKAAVLAFAILAFIFLICWPVSADNTTAWSSMSSGTRRDLNSIWGDGDSVFAAGKSGAIVYYDGSAWSTMRSSTAVDLSGVWGADGSNYFAVGKSGTIVYYDGTAWSSMSSGTASDLSGVWGSDNTDVFAVGKSGTILRYNGTAWSTMSSGTTSDLSGVWGSDNTDVFAVGKSGTVLRYNGAAWSPMSSSITKDLNCIWGADGTDIFAAGNSGTIIHYNGAAWSVINSGTTGDLYGIWGATGNDIFVVGESGTIAYYNGSTWSSMSRNTLYELHAVWGSSADDVFAAGWSGTILRYFPPVIDSISRDQGDQGATLSITITGTNFTGASEVQFGKGIAVNSFTVLRSTRITANIQIVAGAAEGARDVSVTTPGGRFTLPESFTVKQALPTITSISPDQDKQGATLSVTITGTNLAGASDVRLGTGIAVDSFGVINPEKITADITIVSGTATGPRNITVTTPGGSYTLPDGFTVTQALPTITSVSPDQDKQGATLNVTITGTNLTGANEVRFSTGISVNSFSVISTNQIAANITIIADAATGSKNVSVATPGGTFTLPDGFRVKQASPTITSINPVQGNQATSLTVTLDGTNLAGTGGAVFGSGINVNSLTVLSSNQVAVEIKIAAGAEIGTRDISVTTPGGSFSLPNSFTVKQALPVIASLSPDYGSQGATLGVTITGRNFSGASDLRFGTGIALNSFTVLDSNKIAADITIVAGAAIGAMDVSVVTPGGFFSLPNGFTVKQGLPSIISIIPDNGSQGATLTIIINGSNLGGATSVSFGSGVAVQSFSNLSPTQLSVNLTIGEDAATGVRDISVTTPGGSSTLGNSFSIKEKSFGTLIIAMIWIGIVVVVVLFVLFLRFIRKKRGLKV
jgi:hypothetical protein